MFGVALTLVPRSADLIARTAGLVEDGRRCTGHARRQVQQALQDRDGVRVTKETRGDKTTTLYAQAEDV